MTSGLGHSSVAFACVYGHCSGVLGRSDPVPARNQKQASMWAQNKMAKIVKMIPRNGAASCQQRTYQKVHQQNSECAKKRRTSDDEDDEDEADEYFAEG